MRRTRADFSRDEARRIAVAAQGFGRPRPSGRVDTRHFRGVFERLKVVQLDSVNVLARAHYLPFYSRLGPYSRDALDRWLWRSGELFEYWGHEASLLSTAHRPLFAHRMQDPRQWPRLRGFGLEQRALVERVLAEVRDRGPISVSEVEGHETRTGWWGWSEAKRALEYLFLTGEIAVTDRLNFSRRYDLPERVHPAELLASPAIEREAAHLELLALGGSALGIGTAHDLTDYFRLPLTATRALLALLVERGDLERVSVDGWREPAYLHRDAALPRRVEARALLAPFDPLVWYRDRAERLFDFRYRIEIYTPAPQRVYGYYVLPFLLDDRLVARIDLKADRSASALLVRTAHGEANIDVARVASELTEEFASMAHWLALETVKIEAPGAFGDALRQAAPAPTPTLER
jgi:uncharacterized protein YcaQ